jgi:hypothetical protein
MPLPVMAPLVRANYFRPTATDGVWRVFFARFVISEVDLRDHETNIVTVRYVSERTSGLSPV